MKTMLRILKRWKRSGTGIPEHGDDQVLHEDAFRRMLERERERSGRNRHAVSLVLLNVGEPSILRSRVVQIIRSRIRRVDEIGWYDDCRLGILLPYTNREGACRLTCEILAQLDLSPTSPVEVFTFPSDGMGGQAVSDTTSGVSP